MNGTKRRLFGTTPAGEKVELLCLEQGNVSCSILTFGAIIQSLVVPDREGKQVDVALGYDTLEEYIAQDGYLGAVVGRYGNRIAKGRFTLHGKEYTLTVNNGVNHLHGGTVGFSHRVWVVEELTGDRAVLSLDSPDGEEGYPGRLSVRVTYTLTGEGLELHYEAVADRDTPCNLTNHSYFNLSGHDSGSALDQVATLFAQRYVPIDETSIPLGELAAVEGTPMDFRTPTVIGARINEPFIQLLRAKGYDHSYVVDGTPGTLRKAAIITSPRTGIRLRAETTMPGVQLYSANYLTERKGKGEALYAPRCAFCLETQFFPDSPNQPAFPSAILKAGEKFDHTTRFLFSTE